MPFTLTAKRRSNTSQDSSRIGRISKSAALLNRMSTWPKRCSVLATMRSMSSRRVTSALTLSTRSP